MHEKEANTRHPHNQRSNSNNKSLKLNNQYFPKHPLKNVIAKAERRRTSISDP